jgi:hypothetical protein
MGFQRVIVQPTLRISAPATQEVRFAIRTTGRETAVVWVNVFENTTAVKTIIDVRGASAQTFNDDTMATPSFWPSLATFQIDIGMVGSFSSATIARLPDLGRWAIAALAATLSFDIVLYLWDT